MLNYVQQFEASLSEKLPSCDSELIKLYALLSLVTRGSATWMNTHDAWSMWKNREDPSHRSLISFWSLSPEVQALDDKYTEAINETWHELRHLVD